jgi:transposase
MTGRGSKKASRLGAEVVFLDEFGFSFADDVATTWAPRGQTPILKRVGRYRRELSTIAGLTWSGRIYKRHFRHTIHGEDVVAGLKHIRSRVKKPWLIVVLDRSKPHQSKCVERYIADHPDILLEWLPPYAPELNPEEYCHGQVKQRMRNHGLLSIDALQHRADTEFQRLRRRPDLIHACFCLAGLSVNYKR